MMQGPTGNPHAPGGRRVVGSQDVQSAGKGRRIWRLWCETWLGSPEREFTSASSLCELLGLERDGRSHESGGLTEWKEVERWKWSEELIWSLMGQDAKTSACAKTLVEPRLCSDLGVSRLGAFLSLTLDWICVFLCNKRILYYIEGLDMFRIRNHITFFEPLREHPI